MSNMVGAALTTDTGVKRGVGRPRMGANVLSFQTTDTEADAREAEPAGEGKKSPNVIDVYVGGRIRMRRLFLDMSQERLGKQLGVTFQQVQKYEKGTNRVSASRLQRISEILGHPVSFFFEGMPASTAAEAVAADMVPVTSTPFMTREEIDFNRAFMSITDLKIRRSIVLMVKALAKSSVGDGTTESE